MLDSSSISARFTRTTPVNGQCHPHPFRRPVGYDRRSVQYQRMMTFQLFTQGHTEATPKAPYDALLPESVQKSSTDSQRLLNFLLLSPSPKNERSRTIGDASYTKEPKSRVTGSPTDYQRLLDHVVSSVDYENVLTPEDLSTSLSDLYDNQLRELETSFRDSLSITKDKSSTDHGANERVPISEKFIPARINPGKEPDQIGERRSVMTLKKLATAALPPTREHNRQESETVKSAEREREGIQDESEIEDALLKLDPTEGGLPNSVTHLSDSAINLLLDVEPSSVIDKENKPPRGDPVKRPGDDVVNLSNMAINKTVNNEGTRDQPLGQCKLPDLENILPTTSLENILPTSLDKSKDKDSDTSILPVCDVDVDLDITQIMKEIDEVQAEDCGVGNKPPRGDPVKRPGDDVVYISNMAINKTVNNEGTGDLAINKTVDTEGISHHPLGQCKLPDLENILPTTSLENILPRTSLDKAKDKDSDTSILPVCDVDVDLDITQIVKEIDEVEAENAGVGNKDAIQSEPTCGMKRNVKEVDTADDLAGNESTEPVKKQRPASRRRLRPYSKPRVELEQLNTDPAGYKPVIRDDRVKPTELVESSIPRDECQKPMDKVNQTLEMEPPVVSAQPKNIYLNADHSFMDKVEKVDGSSTKLSHDVQDAIIDTSRIRDIVTAKLREIRAECDVLDLEPDETTPRLWNESLEGMGPSTSSSLSKDSSSSLSEDSSSSLPKDSSSPLSKDSSSSLQKDSSISLSKDSASSSSLSVDSSSSLPEDSSSSLSKDSSSSLTKDSSSSLSKDTSSSLSKDSSSSSLSKDSSKSVTTDKKMTCKELSRKERLEMRKRRFGETLDTSPQTKTNDKRRKIVIKRIVF